MLRVGVRSSRLRTSFECMGNCSVGPALGAIDMESTVYVGVDEWSLLLLLQK